MAFDGFLTIWMLTLPEKFKEWAKYQENLKGRKQGLVMDYSQVPKFPLFELERNSTKLLPYTSKDCQKGTYNFLPDSWKLLTSFEYFLGQKAIWTTQSIEDEYEGKWDKKTDNNLHAQDEASNSNSGHVSYHIPRKRQNKDIHEQPFNENHPDDIVGNSAGDQNADSQGKQQQTKRNSNTIVCYSGQEAPRSTKKTKKTSSNKSDSLAVATDSFGNGFRIFGSRLQIDS